MNNTDESKKVTKPIERVTISENMKTKLQILQDHANETLQGMASVSKSDIVNLLLDIHDGTLSKIEIEKLRTAHFDEVRFVQWMANRLKSARLNGESVSLMELIERGKSLVTSPPEKARRRSKKNKGEKQEESNDPRLNESETI